VRRKMSTYEYILEQRAKEMEAIQKQEQLAAERVSLMFFVDIKTLFRRGKSCRR
jgi:hypothetical protein